MQALVTSPPRALADVIDGFLLYLKHVKGLADNTVFHYGHDLSLFLRYLSQDLGCSVLAISLDEIAPKHIEGFLQFLTATRNNCDRSTKRRLAALRSFFGYVYDSDPDSDISLYSTNPTEHIAAPKVGEQPPRTLSGEEAVRILRAARAHGPNPVRDYAILRLFLHCGARLSEVLYLRLGDVNLSENYVYLGANSNRARIVPLSDETHHALSQYIASRPESESDRIFISRNGRPITKGTIYHLVSKCQSSAALENTQVNIHTMRHTCYTLLAKEGFGPYELQVLAGLRRPQMPKAYCRLAASSEQQIDE